MTDLQRVIDHETTLDSMMFELISQMPHGVVPTSLRFFTPTKVFWEQLETHREEIIAELGAGKGDTTYEMKQAGFRAVGCDSQAPMELFKKGVHCLNALQFPLTTGMHVIICRPDHSGWCALAIRRALKAGCTVWYVGLEENAPRDLGAFYGMEKRIVPDAGEEEEAIWEFIPN